MKLKEAMGATGSHTLMGPGTNINTQVVQPRTRQAVVPEQGLEYEKAKNRSKEQKKNDVSKYNDREEDKLPIYYDDKDDDPIDDMFGKIMNHFKKVRKGKNNQSDSTMYWAASSSSED